MAAAAACCLVQPSWAHAQDSASVTDLVDRLQNQMRRLEAETIAAQQRAGSAEKAAANARARVEILERRLTGQAEPLGAPEPSHAYTVSMPASGDAPSNDLPAVSALNFKLDASAGGVGGQAAFASGQTIAIR